MSKAADVVIDMGDAFRTLARVHSTNGAVFTVRGWPFAIVRNGMAWDVLSPDGLEQNIDKDELPEAIEQIVIGLAALEGEWDFDEEEVTI